MPAHGRRANTNRHNVLRPDKPGASTPTFKPLERQALQSSFMYADAKDSLKNILDWLDGSDHAGWERQIELGENCRSEMERTAPPKYSGARKGSHTFGPERNPDAGKLNRAIPHVRAMLSAMRNRNRAAALEHGRAALG